MEKKSLLTKEEKEFFMAEALREAQKAEALAEVPIGAIVVLDGEIIGRGHNLREDSQDATAHAEIFAIKEACEAIGNWRLERAQLFVTLEPCPMCSGAMILSRVDEVYFGAYDPKGGTAGSLLNLLEDERFNHRAYVEGGILEETCGQQLTTFFKGIRSRKKLAKKLAKKLQEDFEKD
ncbi:tRNA-specific adenosine deaminase [Enterococcus sp. JM4C]|uniref:tRNA adenosine(34) deaminase TadA n=1 Tax=Candidatus Enterococcus huntleyi TaxID=1857217 RepID=UPI00137B772F|nr:tRNA adenosine(34) deaminase TadA [Enterococcus sp. JM4C]KAF1298318.1 tRNA-specific adenosine deaminase [Enterococcus sp. JM4C]